MPDDVQHQREAMPRRMLRRKFLLLLVSLAVSFVLLEAGISLLAARGAFNIHIPSYSLRNTSSSFWVNTNPDFGVWHEPHSRYRHTKHDFSVEYEANSYGARDVERTVSSGGKERVVVLGDSFVEGYGSSLDRRMTNLLEDRTGVEHLNFGTSGSFGTIQYWLLYEKLASKFEHDAVMICVLPSTDFWDNDLDYGKKYHSDIYRPYLIGDYPDYRLIYYLDTIPRRGWCGRADRRLKDLLREFSYSYNMLRYWRDSRAMKSAMSEKEGKSGPGYSGYYHFTEKDFGIMKYTIGKMAEIATGKRVTVVMIPVLGDIEMYDRIGAPPLSEKMQAFCSGRGIACVDLLPFMHGYTTNWPDYFHTFDPHWNDYGNRVVADHLAEALVVSP